MCKTMCFVALVWVTLYNASDYRTNALITGRLVSGSDLLTLVTTNEAICAGFCSHEF